MKAINFDKVASTIDLLQGQLSTLYGKVEVSVKTEKGIQIDISKYLERMSFFPDEKKEENTIFEQVTIELPRGLFKFNAD